MNYELVRNSERILSSQNLTAPGARRDAARIMVGSDPARDDESDTDSDSESADAVTTAGSQQRACLLCTLAFTAAVGLLLLQLPVPLLLLWSPRPLVVAPVLLPLAVVLFMLALPLASLCCASLCAACASSESRYGVCATPGLGPFPIVVSTPVMVACTGLELTRCALAAFRQREWLLFGRICLCPFRCARILNIACGPVGRRRGLGTALNNLWAHGDQWTLDCYRYSAWGNYMRRLDPYTLRLFNTKRRLKRWCSKHGVPIARAYSLRDPGFTLPAIDFIIKPNGGSSGEGVEMYIWLSGGQLQRSTVGLTGHKTQQITDTAELEKSLRCRASEVVCETRLINHPEIQSLVGPEALALCTFRVTTVLVAARAHATTVGREEVAQLTQPPAPAVHCLCCVLRLCQDAKSPVDNKALFVDVDYENGGVRAS
eukprot:COSAG02_NODE_2163_length_9619_cov_7.068592_9_plen_430_part_00